MKLLVLLSVLFSLNVRADHHENFEEHKKMMLENIDKRIANLGELKSCISAATSKDQAHACREKFKDEREDMKSQRKQRREEWKAKKKAAKEAAKSSTTTP